MLTTHIFCVHSAFWQIAIKRHEPLKIDFGPRINLMSSFKEQLTTIRSNIVSVIGRLIEMTMTYSIVRQLGSGVEGTVDLIICPDGTHYARKVILLEDNYKLNFVAGCLLDEIKYSSIFNRYPEICAPPTMYSLFYNDDVIEVHLFSRYVPGDSLFNVIHCQLPEVKWIVVENLFKWLIEKVKPMFRYSQCTHNDMKNLNNILIEYIDDGIPRYEFTLIDFGICDMLPRILGRCRGILPPNEIPSRYNSVFGLTSGEWIDVISDKAIYYAIVNAIYLVIQTEDIGRTREIGYIEIIHQLSMRQTSAQISNWIRSQPIQWYHNVINMRGRHSYA